SATTSRATRRPRARSSPWATRPRRRRFPLPSWRRGPWWPASSSTSTRPSTNERDGPPPLLHRRRPSDAGPARAPDPRGARDRLRRAPLDAREGGASRRGNRRPADAAPLPPARAARHLALPGRRTLADRHLGLQAEAPRDVRQGAAELR